KGALVHDDAVVVGIQTARKERGVFNDRIELERGHRLGWEQHAIHHTGAHQLVRFGSRFHHRVEVERLGEVSLDAAPDPQLETVEVVHAVDYPIGGENGAGTVGINTQQFHASMLVGLAQVLVVNAPGGD